MQLIFIIFVCVFSVRIDKHCALRKCFELTFYARGRFAVLNIKEKKDNISHLLGMGKDRNYYAETDYN